MKITQKIIAWFSCFFGTAPAKTTPDIELIDTYFIKLSHELVAKAEQVVQDVESDIVGAAGENKRHRAFAILQRLAPEASDRDISKAIEIALDLALDYVA